MLYFIIALAAIFIGIVILGSMGIGAAVFFKSVILSKGGPLPIPAPTPAKWIIQYSDYCPPSLADQGDGSYAVDIPPSPGSIHYVVTEGFTPGTYISMRFALEGSGTVIPVPGHDTPPAQVRLYLQRQGDNMMGNGSYEFYRWWSVAKVDITNPGEYQITAPLDPAAWTSVFGRSGTDSLAQGMFQLALQNLGCAGFTFGGASFAGHGDQSVGGPVKFILRSYQ